MEPAPSPLPTNTKSHLPAQAKLVTLALHYLHVLDLIFAEVWKRRCALASDTGDAALREPSA